VKIPFVKMQGLGNDFVVIDAREFFPEDPAAFARWVCNRRLGVGADQVLWMRPPLSPPATTRMEIHNADGSEVGMCGNGVRALALFCQESGVWNGEGQLIVETAGGLVRPRRVEGGLVEVDMGVPRWSPTEVPVDVDGDEVVGRAVSVAGTSLEVTCVSMGNPHCVLFCDEAPPSNWQALGAQIETDPLFPQGTNVEWAAVRSPTELEVTVWERGTGATLACGSGACASWVAAVRAGRCERQGLVHLPGGSLRLHWREEDDHVLQTGPAVVVFRGELEGPGS